jgi:hypothetical protein
MNWDWFMDIVLQSSTFIHIGYIALIFVLFTHNRSTNLMLYKSIDKHITTNEHLTEFKNGVTRVQSEQLRLIKESH